MFDESLLCVWVEGAVTNLKLQFSRVTYKTAIAVTRYLKLVLAIDYRVLWCKWIFFFAEDPNIFIMIYDYSITTISMVQKAFRPHFNNLRLSTITRSLANVGHFSKKTTQSRRRTSPYVVPKNAPFSSFDLKNPNWNSLLAPSPANKCVGFSQANQPATSRRIY